MRAGWDTTLDTGACHIAAFHYLCSLLDGHSRYLVRWEIRERMTEQDVEAIAQRACQARAARRAQAGLGTETKSPLDNQRGDTYDPPGR